MPEFEPTLLGSIQAQEANSPTSNAAILEALAHKAQQRGFQRPSEIDGIAVEFTIELPDDELANIPSPKFFISDRVCWSPLPGEEEPLEGGCIIGMKYWTPGFSAMPVLAEGTNAGWQYLIYLDQNATSRAWVQTDWAFESDLVFQEPHNFSSPPVTKQESTKLEP